MPVILTPLPNGSSNFSSPLAALHPIPTQLISTSELELSIQSATEQIASATGCNLDTQKQANIRRDIAAIWGRGMIVL